MTGSQEGGGGGDFISERAEKRKRVCARESGRGRVVGEKTGVCLRSKRAVE